MYDLLMAERMRRDAARMRKQLADEGFVERAPSQGRRRFIIAALAAIFYQGPQGPNDDNNGGEA